MKLLRPSWTPRLATWSSTPWPARKASRTPAAPCRLGNYNCHLAKDSLAAKVYGARDIVERHRHRYECNNAYRDLYDRGVSAPAASNPDNDLVEVIEGVNHPFFLASQYHPEFKSRPNRAHPMFRGFVASLLQK
ncbi:MAG: hypothetical protein WDN27_06800 [Candidatus Saccharibacteria bacterium]